ARLSIAEGAIPRRASAVRTIFTVCSVNSSPGCPNARQVAGGRRSASGKEAAKAPHAILQALRTGGEAPAHESFTLGAERAAGREPQTRPAHQLLAEGKTVGHASDAEEHVHGTLGWGSFDILDRGQFTYQQG